MSFQHHRAQIEWRCLSNTTHRGRMCFQNFPRNRDLTYESVTPPATSQEFLHLLSTHWLAMSLQLLPTHQWRSSAGSQHSAKFSICSSNHHPKCLHAFSARQRKSFNSSHHSSTIPMLDVIHQSDSSHLSLLPCPVRRNIYITKVLPEEGVLSGDWVEAVALYARQKQVLTRFETRYGDAWLQSHIQHCPPTSRQPVTSTVRGSFFSRQQAVNYSSTGVCRFSVYGLPDSDSQCVGGDHRYRLSAKTFFLCYIFGENF